jgi:hypothetical protein
MVEVIDETTVGTLGNARVPMASMTVGSYLLPDGSTAEGPICYLGGAVGGRFVGVGSVVVVEGQAWTVVSVDKTPGQLGSVTLRT